MDDTRATMEALATAERERRSAALRERLGEADRLDAWIADDSLPADVRKRLAEGRGRLAVEVLDLLTGWTRRGGSIELGSVVALEPAPPPPAAVEVVPPPMAPPPAAVVRAPTPGPEAESAPVAQAGQEATIVPPPPAAARPTPPPAEVADDPVRKGPRATDEALASLKARLEGEPSKPVPPPAEWRGKLQAIVAGITPQPDEEADLANVYDASMKSAAWIAFPPDVQRLLLAHLASRLRILQDEREVRDRRIDTSFSTLTAYSARERPGAVRGLARVHRPTRGTWTEDADASWERLVALTGSPIPEANKEKLLDGIERMVAEIARAPVAAVGAVKSQCVRQVKDALAAGVPARDPRLIRLATPLVDLLTGPEMRTLRRAIREEAEAVEEEVADKPQALPPDWRWWSCTRDRRALMIGGSPREPNRVRLEEIFGFAELTWEPSEFRRNNLQTIRNRVKSHGVDLVLILRSFVGHDADEILLPACRDAGVDWAHVEQGYGVQRVRQAIERYLDPEAPPQ